MGKTDSHSSMKETGVKLDSKTPLLNFEKPENSTEPQKNLGLNLRKVTNGTTVQHLSRAVMVARKVVLITMITVITIMDLIMKGGRCSVSFAKGH